LNILCLSSLVTAFSTPLFKDSMPSLKVVLAGFNNVLNICLFSALASLNSGKIHSPKPVLNKAYSAAAYPKVRPIADISLAPESFAS